MKDYNNSEILIYQSENGVTKIDVTFMDETVWLSQQQMAELFQTSRTNVVEHIKHIYEEGELDEESTCRNFRQVRKEGNREVSRELPFYNLDMIISLGYRIKSIIATNFRRWATERLKEYMIKGFTMDDERLKKLGGGNYWKELLDRIRDIRSSEKVMYRQVLDLYATSVDYNPKSAESVAFFKMVQNKLHYAAHGHTAAEVIYERADAEKPFMGLRTFSGDFPTKKDIGIAKNYLDEKELKVLNNIVSGYFEFAEIQAMRHNPMYMSDYVEHLDNILKVTGEKLLEGVGSVSHVQAMEKASEETYCQWSYIAGRAYETGAYSYEADRTAQHEVFLTREDRLVPMQSELLLKRRDRIPTETENAMLRHLGGIASREGHFWDKTPDALPEDFKNNKMRRWFHTFNYINQFRGSELYLADAVSWLQKQAREDGLWDWGPQTNDPWGYFGYFSCNRHYGHNRVVDCTMEILSFLKQYMVNNELFVK